MKPIFPTILFVSGGAVILKRPHLLRFMIFSGYFHSANFDAIHPYVY